MVSLAKRKQMKSPVCVYLDTQREMSRVHSSQLRWFTPILSSMSLFEIFMYKFILFFLRSIRDNFISAQNNPPYYPTPCLIPPSSQKCMLIHVLVVSAKCWQQGYSMQLFNNIIAMYFQTKPVAFAVRTNVAYDGSLDDDSPVHGCAVTFGVKDFLHIKEVHIKHWKIFWPIEMRQTSLRYVNCKQKLSEELSH